MPEIHDSVLELIGNTPCVSLKRLAAHYGLECELIAKCEYFSAGGSIKDRIALRMLVELEKEGKLKPGDTVIEPTSGNTGIGLALVSAIKGYNALITLPEKMSLEKVNVLKALGAQIVRTPTEAAWDSPDSHIGVARRLNKEIKNSIIPDQYTNVNNPLAHYYGTAEEILRQTDGKLDMFVAGAGTGGTLSGTARKLKEKIPSIKVVGVDPKGSILALPEQLNAEGIHSYQVEGIGYDFIPDVLERSLVDEWIKSDDQESFLMARDAIRLEGLLCGGSCGSALVGAIKAAKSLKKGQRCLVILPDSIRNYMSKHLNEDWMIDHGFMPSKKQNKNPLFENARVGDLVKELGLSQAVTVTDTTPCKEAINIMEKNGFDQLPITSYTSNRLAGLITLGHLLSKIGSKVASLDSPLSTVMMRFNPTEKKQKAFIEVNMETMLDDLESFFELHPAALISERDDSGHLVVKHVVTKVDLLSYLVQKTQT